MINVLDVFFPCLLLIFCIFLGCAFYKVIRDGAFCSIVCGSSEHSFRRSGRGTNTSSSQRNTDVTAPNPHEFLDNGVETSMRQNIASAIIAGREARRLANILANSRGISPEECLESVRISAQNSAGAMMFEFDDEDLPPSYEECVSPSNEDPKSEESNTLNETPKTEESNLSNENPK